MWWLAANVCELRAGQCDAVMLCQEMQGVIMDTDEMQHAGCRNYACDLTTLNELQSCRVGNSYGDGHQACWYLGDCECRGW